MHNVKDIATLEKEIIEDFSLFDDWTEKYQYIIELGQTGRSKDVKAVSGYMRTPMTDGSILTPTVILLLLKEKLLY